MIKRVIAIVLAAVILSTLQSINVDKDKAENSEPDRDTIVIELLQLGGSIDDFSPIADAINEIVQKELDVTLEFEVSNYGDSHYLTTFISTDERPDLFYSSETEFLAANNFVLPLDDLLNEYGEDILNLYDDYILDACRYHGSLYGIVSNKDFAASECICVRKDLLDKYSIPYEWMSDWDTMVKAFDVIKENEPDMYCVNTYLFSQYDPLGDYLGVIPYTGSTTVINYFETDSFKNQIARQREWYLKGYTIPGWISECRSMMAEGKLFSYITKYKPGFDTQESKFTGYEMISFELSEAYMNTSTATNGQWSISSTCENPEKAMQVLNMLFSNSDIMNLLRWGIEGEHYVMLDNGFIDYPEGVDAENLSYNMTANWYLPNQYISYIWNGDISTLGKDVKKFNSEAIRSPALGFRFNSGPVAPEYEAVSEIYSTYVECFTRGELELETAYPEFLDLLDKAGLDTIIAEKQRQLDEWFAENG